MVTRSHLFGPETRQNGKPNCLPHDDQEAKKEAGEEKCLGTRRIPVVVNMDFQPDRI